jgi:malate permease and related proteins
MNNYILLAVCFLLGIVLRRSGRMPDNAAAALNGFVITVSLPALTLTHIHSLDLDTGLLLPASMAWLMFALGCGYFWMAARIFGFSRATTGGLMLVGGLGNTSFVGLPMIEAFYGAEFFGVGILISQVGSYFVLSTVGIMVASFHSAGQRVEARTIVRKIVLFIPFQAFVVALVSMPFEYPVWLDDLLRRLGATLVPFGPGVCWLRTATESGSGKGEGADRWSPFQVGAGPGSGPYDLCRSVRRGRAAPPSDRV